MASPSARVTWLEWNPVKKCFFRVLSILQQKNRCSALIECVLHLVWSLIFSMETNILLISWHFSENRPFKNLQIKSWCCCYPLVYDEIELNYVPHIFNDKKTNLSLMSRNLIKFNHWKWVSMRQRKRELINFIIIISLAEAGTNFQLFSSRFHSLSWNRASRNSFSVLMYKLQCD